MDIDNNSFECEDSPVKMVVLDGIVMGPTHCAFENCVFCAEHDILCFGLCHIKNCNIHQHNWQSHIIRFGQQTLLGICRIIRCSEEEQHIWLPQAPNQQHTNYFIAPQFYCVETICAPCACLLLRTAVQHGAWDVWGQTTCFIVDSYHYINHCTTDYICQKWYNPAPLNGSAPNLQGNPHYKQAFNTQVRYIFACEQLNAWIGGFQSSNFNWTMHSLLFIHTQHIIKKQQKKRNNNPVLRAEESDENEEIDG
ncbi:hypothetical protein BDQ12DRAFT_698258 [Crucibulum laeve]|uniref:CxC6 like cysteine cluster associated with KDZ domain-containing protein n=1 Tax=Crucibulum laeve TaxID=68775 RepID=A0A5C3M5W9_9AGAR|nr:hypothetical protein BDQ12DRAFT_698258 [Crucibulum laeve]